MSIVFDDLPRNLHSGADRVAKYLRQRQGLRKLVAEKPIGDDFAWVPTLSGVQSDHHIVAVDVTDAPYPTAMSNFIAQVVQSGEPIKVYVAIPESSPENTLKTYDKAKKLGVGLLRIYDNKCTEEIRPIALSLSGLRRIDLSKHAPDPLGFFGPVVMRESGVV